MKTLPKARTADIVVQNLNDEVLIYNLKTDKAYCLNETSAKVFNYCDGKTPFDELKNKYQFTDDVIFLTLDELKKKNLLADESYVSPFAGMNRREVITKVGMASMISMPKVSALIAPTAAGNASARANNGVACMTPTNNSTECKSGTCQPTFNNTYDPMTGEISVSQGGSKCCVPNGGMNTGTYQSYSQAGVCNFSTKCCTGTGTEFYNQTRNEYYCTCAATS